MFFLIICILLALILIICQLKVNKTTKKIVIIYVIWTLIILGFSTLNLFNTYDVSSIVYFMWIINILMITFSILIFSKKNMVEDKEWQKNTIQKIENSKILFYFSIIISILLLYYKFRYDRIVENLPLEYIRMARFDRLFTSGIESIFFDYILINSLRILLIITSILIVNGKYKNRICILGIISLAIYTMIGYGRMTIFEFIIYVVISYLIFNYRGKKAKLKVKKIILWIFLAIILIFIGAIVTVIRLKGIELLNLETIFEYGILEQIKQIYVYFTGGFRTLEVFIRDGFYTLDGLTLGRLTFGGIEDIVGLILNNIGYNFETINSLIGTITQTNVQIGEHVYINAFYTCIMNFYGDMGYLGVIVYSLLHGIFIAYSINNYIKKKNLLAFILLSYVVMNALCSVYRWQYQFGQYVFIMIILLILNFKVKDKKKIDNDNI